MLSRSATTTLLTATARSRVQQLSLHIRMASSTPTPNTAQTTPTTPTTLKLNTGASIPALGFGTWQDADAQATAVETALRAGYRHIDTAYIYGTEGGVAQGIAASGVPRSSIFITTKLWNNAHHPSDVEPQLDASLKNLATDYVDLYLMHWPGAFKRGAAKMPRDSEGKIQADPDVDFLPTYRAMEAVFRSGKARAIGVSNFSLAEMQRLLDEAEVVPAAHQYENHPYLAQHEFFAWHVKNGIHVTQYSPFGNQNEIYDKGKSLGKLIEDPVLVEIGEKYGKSGAQVALAWGIAKGRSVIPKSKTEHRIKENLEGDFKLEQADVERIDQLDRKLRFNNPSKGFGYQFFTDLDGAS